MFGPLGLFVSGPNEHLNTRPCETNDLTPSGASTRPHQLLLSALVTLFSHLRSHRRKVWTGTTAGRWTSAHGPQDDVVPPNMTGNSPNSDSQRHTTVSVVQLARIRQSETSSETTHTRKNDPFDPNAEQRTPKGLRNGPPKRLPTATPSRFWSARPALPPVQTAGGELKDWMKLMEGPPVANDIRAPWGLETKPDRSTRNHEETGRGRWGSGARSVGGRRSSMSLLSIHIP